MAKIALYGGVREVGGNKVLLEDHNSRVILDFGVSYAQRDRFFSDPFLSPKTKEVLVKLGVARPIDGVYWFQELQKDTAVFISHAHRDHSGHISLLNRQIPVFCGKTTEIILDGFKEISRDTPEFDLSGLEFKNFKSWDLVKFGDISIKPIHVDHSVPGSYAFLVELDGKTLAYTGDFRMHGEMQSLTQDFADALLESRPDVLVIEHTNILDGEVSSEAEVEQKVQSVVDKAGGLVISDFSVVDIDRYKTFSRVAERVGRNLVVTPRRAFMLKMMEEDPRIAMPKLEDTYVLRSERKQTRAWEELVYGIFKNVTIEELSSSQRSTILLIPPTDIESLLRIDPAPGSIYICSSSEPYDEEMEMDFERLMNWLDFLGIPFYRIHASGHVMPLQIRQLIEATSPKMLIPIHGKHPDLFAKYVRDLCENVRIPDVGESIEFNT